MPESSKLTVAWISDFPVEWLPDIPKALQHLPKPHSMSWQRVLLEEFEKDPSLDLNIYAVRRNIGSDHHFQRNGVSFHVVNVSFPRAQTLYWWDTWVLRRHLRKLQPDVVHAWGTERGAALIAERLGFPYVATVQGLMTWYVEIMELNFHEKLAAYYEKKCLPRAPLVTTESTFAVEFLKKRFPGIRVHQAEHAPNWLFHNVKRDPQTTPVRFVFVGLASHRKGADLLFTALEALVNEFPFELILIGRVDPRFQASVDRAMASPLWKRVTMKENLTASEVAQEFGRATLLLFPTRADTSPNTVKEAAVAGLPVVASAVGGITDYVLPGRNGLLFPSEDLAAFTRSIREAVAHPLLGKGQVEAKTLASVREYLSPRRMAERFREAYDLVLRAK
jgi:glycosyltransferase involved in cell wall biosynthesis